MPGHYTKKNFKKKVKTGCLKIMMSKFKPKCNQESKKEIQNKGKRKSTMTKFTKKTSAIFKRQKNSGMFFHKSHRNLERYRKK
jgi:catabolite regulation protein CreA